MPWIRDGLRALCLVKLYVCEFKGLRVPDLSGLGFAWTLKVCRKIALYRSWTIMLSTFGGLGGVLVCLQCTKSKLTEMVDPTYLLHTSSSIATTRLRGPERKVRNLNEHETQPHNTYTNFLTKSVKSLERPLMKVRLPAK